MNLDLSDKDILDLASSLTSPISATLVTCSPLDNPQIIRPQDLNAIY
jgi:hypothetical protein